jgi:hypothetical protein
VSDDETRLSGSRWEPATAAGPDGAPTADVLRPVPVDPPAPRRNLRRAGLLAAAAAGLLAIGGAGGYAVGHSTASAAPGLVSGQSGATGGGTGGGPGAGGHHHGQFGQDGGQFGQDGGGDGTGAQAPQAGTGSTGAST